RADVRRGPGGRSEGNPRHGLAGVRKAIRVTWIPPVAANPEGRTDAGTGPGGSTKEYAALRQEADHLVPQGIRRRLAHRVRRPAVHSASRDRTGSGLLTVRCGTILSLARIRPCRLNI